MKAKIIAAAVLVAAATAHGQNVIGRTDTIVDGGHRIDVQEDGKQSVMPESIFTNCVAWQAFSYSDNSDANFYDLSTAGNDGAQTNAAAQPTWSSASGGVYDFDGVDDNIDMDAILPSVASNTAGTMNAWIKTSVATPNIVISFTDASANTIVMTQIISSGIVRSVATVAGANKWDLRTNAANATGVWVNVSCSHNGTAPVLYVNGVAVAQTFITQSDKTVWISGLTGLDKARIGASRILGNPDASFFTGQMGEVRVYNRGLSAAETLAIYNATKATYGL
jgi:hypothetical protein